MTFPLNATVHSLVGRKHVEHRDDRIVSHGGQRGCHPLSTHVDESCKDVQQIIRRSIADRARADAAGLADRSSQPLDSIETAKRIDPNANISHGRRPIHP